LQSVIEYKDIFVERDIDSFKINVDQLKGKRVLITGSQGMVGGAISVVFCELLTRGLLDCKLFLASRSWAWIEPHNPKNAIHRISNDEVRSRKHVFDVIIHCASPSNITKISTLADLREVNLGYLDDCITPETSKIIFISSGEIYGGKRTAIDSTPPIFDSQQRRNWYPIAKVETEQYLKEKCFAGNISVDIIRLFHTFGPGVKPDDGRSFADIIYEAANYGKVVLKSKGHQVRSYLYLGDMVHAIFKCLRLGKGYKIFNVGSPHALSILEFASLVGSLTGSTIEFRNEEFEHSPFISIVPDISETRLIGWEPQIDLKESISRTLTWIRN